MKFAARITPIICRDDILWEALKRVGANHGAAGVDSLTIAEVQNEYGPERMLRELRDALRAGTYRPEALRRVHIAKSDGSKRPLGIPTLEDRVCRQAAKIVFESIFEADFAPCSCGFRPKRSATDALERCRVGFIEGNCFIFEADSKNFFGEIDHGKLLSMVTEQVSDRCVLKHLAQWEVAGVLIDGVVSKTVKGTPQDGVNSPLLANIYLNVLDQAWNKRGSGEIVRYASDFVVLCKSPRQAEQAKKQATAVLAELGLSLHPGKTRVVDLREGREGFDFLVCHLRARMSSRLWEQKRIICYYLQRWPSIKSTKHARAQIKAMTDRSQLGKELKVVIRRLNLFLRGWGNYFGNGNASIKFSELDKYVWWRLFRMLVKKRGRNLHNGQADRWTSAWFKDQGLYHLHGTIRYTRRRRNHVKKTVCKPCAGKPHTRIERGMGNRVCSASTAPLTTNENYLHSS